jgi:hypothetical protein
MKLFLPSLCLLCSLSFSGCPKPAKELVPATPTPYLRGVPSPPAVVHLPKGDLSPDGMLSYVNNNPKSDLGELWERLAIKNFHIDVNPEYLEFKAEKFLLGTDQAVPITLIRIEQNRLHYRHLFFRHSQNSEGKWNFLSYVDEYEQKYGPPAVPRAEAVGYMLWAVVPSRGWYGTGIGATYNTWYSLSSKEAKPVLIEAKHHDYGAPGGPVISDELKVKKKGLVNGRYTVVLTYELIWGGKNQGPIIPIKQGHLTYVWDSKKKDFVFERSRSTMTDDERRLFYLEKQYDVGFDSSLDLYLTGLRQAARRGSEEQKDWLRDYLKKVKKTPAARRLQRELGD